MTELLALLAMYYACDEAASHRPMSLTKSDRVDCVATYYDVTAQFALDPLAPDGTAQHAAQRRAAYVAFKTWEAENADLVATMRAQARFKVLYD